MGLIAVPMRMPTGDCQIAAIATVANRPYEEIAEALGFKLNQSGIPTGTPWPAEPCERTGKLICDRLARYGFHPADGITAVALFLGMSNIDAVFFVDSDHPSDNGSAHCLARVDGQILDPRQPKAPIDIADVGNVYFAMVRLSA